MVSFSTVLANRAQRRIIRRRMRQTPLYKSIANAVHSFKRMGQSVVIQGSSAGGLGLTVTGNTGLLTGAPSAIAMVNGNFAWSGQFGLGFKFNLAQVVNSTDLTNLFDSYRIKAVKLVFNLSYNVASGFVSGTSVAAQSSVIPLMHIAEDVDDASTPGSALAVQELTKCRTKRLTQTVSMMVRPRAQQSIVGMNGTQGGLLNPKTWLDTASTGIDHFGVKCWIEDWPIGSIPQDRNVGITVTPTYYIECKTAV